MTLLVDSSAWIEFIRGTGAEVGRSVRRAIDGGEAATTDAVRLEVLAGSYREPGRSDLTAFLDGCIDLSQSARNDVESAVDIYHVCRRSGETIRSLNDCLIAAIAIRHGVAVLHDDRDFDVMARYTDLRVAS
ncbi:PIN domain nuclease [uncultured Jatrophihabitans sp.]|uniref:type II toxin-antitoxin system VapC family toxin n=1 Tax=uncultured Jatrophihabitans sp. TaxID=1610747 RepID=UPI0035CA6A17